VAGFVHIDVSEIRAAYLELRFAGDGLHLDLREGLKAAGQDMVDAVRRETAWSTRIPMATSVAVSFAARSTGVTVRVDARRAPEARPINHGGQGGTFWHPVYGNRKNWVSQPARPFSNNIERTPGIEQKVQAVLDHVAFHAGFR
jgi:hypothetical protein